MPWAWAIPHMIAGVTAAPRWQWSSARGILRESWRFMGRDEDSRRPSPFRPDRPGAEPGGSVERSDEGRLSRRLGHITVGGAARVPVASGVRGSIAGRLERELPGRLDIRDRTRARARWHHDTLLPRLN